jgi:gliding motility-associated-like protein
MDTTEITLNQPSEMTISVSETEINCYGIGDGTITADASGGTPIPGIPPEYEYVWSNTFNEQIDVSTVINLVPGIYTVTATDNNGCPITSESVYITEPSNPLTITVDSIDESCELNDGQATAFVLGGTLPYTYDWNNVSGLNQIVGLSPGLYTVEIIDANGCTISSSTFVNGVTNIFLPGNLSELDTTICLGNSVFIDIEEKPTLTYRWEDGPFDGWQQADRWITPTEPVNVYTLEITDPDCVPYTVTVIINVNDVPVNLSTNNSTHQFAEHPILSTQPIDPITIDPITGDTLFEPIHTVSVSLDATIDLFSDNNNCDTYNWTWVDGYSPTQYISVKPQESGWYYIAVESAGCLGFDAIYVIVGGVNPFDAITPNNDDYNDFWEIVGIEKYNDALIQVFNRWGSIVFEHSGGASYSLGQQWDGTNNGNELPVGTYYYIIDLKNDTELISGPITIIR